MRYFVHIIVALLLITLAVQSVHADDGFKMALEELLERDQRHRGAGSGKDWWARQEPLDRENIVRLEELLQSHEWPRLSEVGEDAAIAAFLVVQHADVAYQEKYLPIIRQRYEQGEAKGGWVALLTDRIRVRQGQPQLYGTQSRMDEETGKNGLYSIEDPEQVDAPRAELGMKPLMRLPAADPGQ
ncbi:MAG: hypothetical protein GX826_08535 [Gammaproteobacteria bacterium]|nr:hypothetical protein [Gammaproteobacteria bacterium]